MTTNENEIRLTGAFRDEIGEGKYRYRGCVSIQNLTGRWTVPRIHEMDDGYQRDIVPAKVAQIKERLLAGGVIKGTAEFIVPAGVEFVWDRKNRTLTVPKVPGQLLRLLDAQHRLVAADEYIAHCVANNEKAREIMVQVAFYTGMTPKDEADLFDEINGTQKPVSKAHLAEVRHRFGQESDVEAVSSAIFDELKAPGAPYETVKVVRSNFLKLTRPLLDPKRKSRVNLSIEARKDRLVHFLMALAEVVSPDNLKMNCTVRAACGIFEEVLIQAVEQKFVVEGVPGFARFMKPLERLNLESLPTRAGSVVADEMRRLLFPVIEIEEDDLAALCEVRESGWQNLESGTELPVEEEV